MITGNFSGGLNYITKRLPALIIPGLEEPVVNSAGTLQVYPNPADQTVTVEELKITNYRLRITGNESRIFVFDLLGVKIIDLPFSGKVTLSTAALPDGIYLVRCGNAAGKLCVSHR